MAGRATVNLPDLLGAITKGSRLNLDLVQCALGVRPASSPAGGLFEAVLLLQNTTDSDIDVSAKVRPPDRDAKRKKGCFTPAREQVVVGLKPGEAGFLAIPVTVQPDTAPADDYVLRIEIGATSMGKGRPVYVREAEGGGRFDPDTITPELKAQVRQLRQIAFSNKREGRSGVSTRFAIQGAQTPRPDAVERSPDWHSLWSMADWTDPSAVFKQVQADFVALKERIQQNQADIYFALLDVVQIRFRNAGYPLYAGESVYIAKALSFVLSQQLPDGGTGANYPNWITSTSRFLFDRPEVVNSDLPQFFSDTILYDLIRDAIILGFYLITTAIEQDFGSIEDQRAYGESMVNYLERGDIDFAYTYLPLVLCGLIANTQVVLPEERPRETVWLLHRAWEHRQPEKEEFSEPVFRMARQLIDQALDQAG
jgi:hypothetical protein